MDRESIELILQKLEKDLNIEKSEDFIGDLLELRANDIDKEISNDKDYKNYIKQISTIEEEIENKVESSFEIIKLIEKYEHIEYENCRRREKLMYKYGVYDGMKLIIEGLKDL